jgi:hypothetical protein
VKNQIGPPMCRSNIRCLKGVYNFDSLHVLGRAMLLTLFKQSCTILCKAVQCTVNSPATGTLHWPSLQPTPRRVAFEHPIHYTARDPAAASMLFNTVQHCTIFFHAMLCK